MEGKIYVGVVTRVLDEMNKQYTLGSIAFLPRSQNGLVPGQEGGEELTEVEILHWEFIEDRWSSMVVWAPDRIRTTAEDWRIFFFSCGADHGNQPEWITNRRKCKGTASTWDPYNSPAIRERQDTDEKYPRRSMECWWSTHRIFMNPRPKKVKNWRKRRAFEPEANI